MTFKASLAGVTLAALLAATALAAPAHDPKLQPLAFLAGEWRAVEAGKEVRASYRFTSGGTALMETLAITGKPEMVTMYHADGKDLALTHFCSMGNQPRMRAKPYHDGDTTMSFFFVDATNLPKQAEPHMRQVTFNFQDRDHVTQTWIMSEDGKERPTTFKFERVR